MELAGLDAASAPPLRVAWHLLRARENAGYTVRDAAEAAGFPLVVLDDLEHGRRVASAEDLERLAGAYGMPVDELVPPRTPVEFDDATGHLRVGGHEAHVGEADGGALASYLSLVYRARGATRGDRIHLRDDDLDVLASLIGDDPDEIEARLIELMDCTPEEARNLGAILFRRRVLGSAAAAILGIAGVVALGGHNDRDARKAAAGSPGGRIANIADPVGEVLEPAATLTAPVASAGTPAESPQSNEGSGPADLPASPQDDGSVLEDWPDHPDLLVNVPTEDGVSGDPDTGADPVAGPGVEGPVDGLLDDGGSDEDNDTSSGDDTSDDGGDDSGDDGSLVRVDGPGASDGNPGDGNTTDPGNSSGDESGDGGSQGEVDGPGLSDGIPGGGNVNDPGNSGGKGNANNDNANNDNGNGNGNDGDKSKDADSSDNDNGLGNSGGGKGKANAA